MATRGIDEETVFADFRLGRQTVFGTSVGGFAANGGTCTAECIPAADDGPTGTVLRAVANLPANAYAGVWFENPPQGRIDLGKYRKLRFDVRSMGGQASWILETKGQRQILAACRVVVPPAKWHRINIPLTDLLGPEMLTLGFDEIVFKFTEPANHLLIGNVRFVK